MNAPDDDPWDAPPEWVHVPDAPRWIARRWGDVGIEIVPKIIAAVRGHQLRYRITGFYGCHNGEHGALPSHLETARPNTPPRVVVRDWEVARPNWQSGDIAGGAGRDGKERRFQIELWRPYVENWMPPRLPLLMGGTPDRTNASAVAVTAQTASEGVSDRTGAPGRPSSRHLVENEFQRRKKAHEVFTSLSDEARWLTDWLRDAHPSLATMTAGTIENTIRADYRAYKRPTK